MQQKPDKDLTVCSNVNYEVREGIHGVFYHCEDEEWTPVVAKKIEEVYSSP